MNIVHERPAIDSIDDLFSLPYGKIDDDFREFPCFAVDPDIASVVTDDPVADAQAQTRS